jgi:hypothetical protein
LLIEDELRPEYDLSQLKGGVRRKSYAEAQAGTNLGSAAVNRALRVVAEAAQTVAKPRKRAR